MPEPRASMADSKVLSEQHVSVQAQSRTRHRKLPPHASDCCWTLMHFMAVVVVIVHVSYKQITHERDVIDFIKKHDSILKEK